MISVVVVLRVPHHVRRSHFILHLWEAGPALQPKGGEHVYLSSRRSIDPCGPASNRGGAAAVNFEGRTIRCHLLGTVPVNFLLVSLDQALYVRKLAERPRRPGLP